MDTTGTSQSSPSETQASIPASRTNQADDEYLIQLLLLDQQNKNTPGYVPRAIRRPSRLDGVIGNLWVGGRSCLTCNTCVHNTFTSDPLLWPDLTRHVHLSIPVEFRTGPDLHQCFCGYFSFVPADLVVHLETMSALTEPGQDRGEVMADLMRRIEQVDMHGTCRRGLVALISTGQCAGRQE